MCEKDSSLSQGELEHRSPKSRYTRTDRKSFVKQLMRIERRQARIRRIRATNNPEGQMTNTDEATTASPEEHHFIGKSQNSPFNIAAHLHENQRDPAIKVRTTGR